MRDVSIFGEHVSQFLHAAFRARRRDMVAVCVHFVPLHKDERYMEG
jgi:hypothetical protein